MDLSTFIVAVFCLIDDRLKDLGCLRTRGPAPTLCDSEVITIELVGEFLGIDEDTQLFGYFRRHYAHYFPNLLRVHRTTFTRQAANLWKAKEYLWQKLLADTPHDPVFALADSFPLPALQQKGRGVYPGPLSLPTKHSHLQEMCIVGDAGFEPAAPSL